VGATADGGLTKPPHREQQFFLVRGDTQRPNFAPGIKS